MRSFEKYLLAVVAVSLLGLPPRGWSQESTPKATLLRNANLR